MSRRTFLGAGVQSAAGLFFGPSVYPLPSWLPRVTLADPHVGPRGDTLVCIFLRGGADGLNIVVPFGDEQYYAQRPTIAINRPDQGSENRRALDLDGFFGLHPTLTGLHRLYAEGDLACVQATGSPDETRSHFEAMDLMERGAVPGEHSGWLARHLATLDSGNPSALRAVAVGDMLPQSLSGALSATAMKSMNEYHLQSRGGVEEAYSAMLQQLYARQRPERLEILHSAAQQTFEALKVIEKSSRSQSGAVSSPKKAYGDHPFGRALQTTAQLIQADAGVEVACVDLGGWDTHVAQGGAEGLMANHLKQLDEGLTAFYEDLDERRERVTVVVMSEFGRRVGENAGAGTDHGHGNMMLALGGGINGGQVIADWPGLHRDQLTGPGDVHITIDYRDILAEILAKRLNSRTLDAIFPDYQATMQGIAVG